LIASTSFNRKEGIILQVEEQINNSFKKSIIAFFESQINPSEVNILRVSER